MEKDSLRVNGKLIQTRLSELDAEHMNTMSEKHYWNVRVTGSKFKFEETGPKTCIPDMHIMDTFDWSQYFNIFQSH